MNKYFVKLINCATKLCVQISGEFHVIRLEEHFCCLCLSKDLELYRTVIFSSFCICRRCSCLNFTLCVAVEVDTKMNFILSSILVIIITVPELYSDRIECVWGYQFLCGDKCLSLDSQCQCGNERIYYNETQYFNCCNDGTCNFDYTGNVNCIGGKKQSWWQKCFGKCQQYAARGWTTMSCDDQIECFMVISSCHGAPKCTE